MRQASLIRMIAAQAMRAILIKTNAVKVVNLATLTFLYLLSLPCGLREK